MISSKNKKIAVLAVAGLIVVSSAAFLVYKLNGKTPDPTSTSGQTVDSIAAADAPSEGSTSELSIPVEGEAVVQDTLVLVVSAAGQVAPWRQSIITAQVAGQVRAVNVNEN